jgi:hypothetical protein
MVQSYSGWMLASLTILPHLPSWTLTKSSNSLGELENASKPTLPSFDLTSGSSMILRSSLLSCRHDRRRRTGRRDDPGPRIHVEAGYPGLVQRWQFREQRAALQAVTASARSAPDRTCGRPVVRSVNIIDTRPASTSWMAGGELL